MTDARRIDLLAAVAARDGVARASSLSRAGHSRHRIAQAIEAGDLVRVRRDWVAAPGADAELIAAARAGVVLSCITWARRAGLWVLAEDRCHVAADPGAAGGKPPAAKVHWSKPLAPRHPDALVDAAPNALVLLARCQPFEAALAAWDSAVRKGIAVPDELARLPLPPAARDVLASVSSFADSGLETIFRVRLRWMRVRILTQIWIAGRPVDFLIGERLVVQLDGGHHVDAQRTGDIAHDAQLKLLGYHVLRFTYAQIIGDWPAVQDTIMRAVAQRLQLAA